MEQTSAQECGRFSVVIPMDRPGRDALRAVESVLRQGPLLRELIVVGGGSLGLPDDPRVRVVVVEDRNPAVRRNRAAAEATGDFLAFIDDDAFAADDWLAVAAQYLDRNPDVVVLGGPDPAPVDSSLGELVSDTLLAARVVGSGVLCHQSREGIRDVRSPHDLALVNMMVRRKAFVAADGFDEAVGYIGEDTELIERLTKKGRAVYHGGVVVYHRRRAFPVAYVRQRWRYRVKTGRLLVSAGARYRNWKVLGFMAVGTAYFAAMLIAPTIADAMFSFYYVLTLVLGASATRLPWIFWLFIPFAFAVHHATYYAGILWGAISELLRGNPRS